MGEKDNPRATCIKMSKWVLVNTKFWSENLTEKDHLGD
jgi:hypothetical protein